MQVPFLAIKGTYQCWIHKNEIPSNNIWQLFAHLLKTLEMDFVISVDDRYPWPSSEENDVPFKECLSEKEISEYRQFMRLHGVLHERLPGALLWKWNDVTSILRVLPGFGYQDRVLWGKSMPEADLLDLADAAGMLSESEPDEEQAWERFIPVLLRNTKYIVTTFPDFVGFLLVLKTEKDVGSFIERWDASLASTALVETKKIVISCTFNRTALSAD
jgi:hypothetical protein